MNPTHAPVIERVVQIIYNHSETTDDGMTCIGGPDAGTHCDVYMGGDQAAHQAEMIRAAGLLAGSPTKEQIAAAARAIFGSYVMWDEDRFEWLAYSYGREKAEYVAGRALTAAAAVILPPPDQHEHTWDPESTPPRRTCGCDEKPAPSPDREKLLAAIGRGMLPGWGGPDEPIAQSYLDRLNRAVDEVAALAAGVAQQEHEHTWDPESTPPRRTCGCDDQSTRKPDNEQLIVRAQKLAACKRAEGAVDTAETLDALVVALTAPAVSFAHLTEAAPGECRIVLGVTGRGDEHQPGCGHATAENEDGVR